MIIPKKRKRVSSSNRPLHSPALLIKRDNSDSEAEERGLIFKQIKNLICRSGRRCF